jgi:Bacterial transglutaminase-like cysteine proteinase BTLCP
MIAEIIPEAYDATGKQVSQPFIQRRRPHPTLPMGRYLSHPLAIHCRSLEEVRSFLRKCRAVSDEEQFGKLDYWLPPEEFEKRKAGDCEDFSLWTWRQLVEMGLDARIVFGRHGRYGIGHAWTMFYADGKCFLLEPQARFLGLRLPRLSTLRYEPKFSVDWDGRTLRYYGHKAETSVHHLKLSLLAALIPEWIAICGRFWLKALVRLPYTLPRALWRMARRKRGLLGSRETSS